MKKFNLDKIAEYECFCFIDSDDEIFQLVSWLRLMTEEEKKDYDKVLFRVDDDYVKVYSWCGSENNNIQGDDMQGYYSRISAVCNIMDYASIRDRKTDIYMFETQSEMYQWIADKLKQQGK